MNSVAPQKNPPQSSTGTPTTTVKGLNPSLGSALSSLNMRLDYELARYRHIKRGTAPPATASHVRSRQRSLELIGVAATSRPRQSPQGKTITPPPVPPNPRLRSPAQPVPVDESPAGSHNPASDNPPASEVAALKSALVRQPEASQPESPQAEEYLASSEALLESFDSPYAGQTPETITQSPEPNWFKQLNTPLGLGALLLLLVTSAGFGFVLVNPVAVRHLIDRTPLARIWPNPDNAELATSPADTPEATAGSPLGEAPLNPLSPDLSQQQFDNLNLNNLSSLPSAASRSHNRAIAPNTSGSTTPGNSSNTSETSSPATAQQAETSVATSTNQPASSPRPAAVTTVNGLPHTTTAPEPSSSTVPPVETSPANPPAAAVPTYEPAPASQPTAVPPTAEPTAVLETAAVATSGSENAAQDFYYVVTDYTGDPSLDTAREAVEEAYVRNFDAGARIQMGAFGSADAAATLAEDLQNQGIEAQVYTPEAAESTAIEE